MGMQNCGYLDLPCTNWMTEEKASNPPTTMRALMSNFCKLKAVIPMSALGWVRFVPGKLKNRKGKGKETKEKSTIQIKIKIKMNESKLIFYTQV